jgi:hypothetical protein
MSEESEMNHLRPDETTAAHLLMAKLAADDVMPRDIPGAPDGTHDLDLKVGDRVLAVEVTTSADAEATSLWEAVHDREWEERSLSRSWGLTLGTDARVKRVKNQAPNHLRVLELNEVDRFSAGQAPPTRDSEVVSTLSSLFALRVVQGIAVDSSPPRIVVATVGNGTWGGAEGLTEVVEREAVANADKLNRAEADERHLFIWLDWTSRQAQAAVSSILRLGVAPPMPELPAGVNTVWVAPGAMIDGGSFLWSVTPPDPWDLSG